MSAEGEYEIINSAQVGEDFRVLSDGARSKGVLRLFLSAAKYILGELGSSPSEFGESRDHFPAAGFSTRCGFARPLMVDYAVNEREKVVYIRRFTWLK